MATKTLTEMTRKYREYNDSIEKKQDKDDRPSTTGGAVSEALRSTAEALQASTERLAACRRRSYD